MRCAGPGRREKTFSDNLDVVSTLNPRRAAEASIFTSSRGAEPIVRQEKCNKLISLLKSPIAASLRVQGLTPTEVWPDPRNKANT